MNKRWTFFSFLPRSYCWRRWSALWPSGAVAAPLATALTSLPVGVAVFEVTRCLRPPGRPFTSTSARTNP